MNRSSSFQHNVGAAVLCLLLLGSCTIVKHEPGKSDGSAPSASAETFDAAAYVIGIWAGKILPEVQHDAVDLRTVLSALKTDPVAARSKFGIRQEESAPYCFVVKGTFRIKSADTESSAATVVLDVPPLNPDSSVQLQIGPVIMTSAVRDGMPFIKFGDFVNQVDFANVSRAINLRIRDTVLSQVPREGLMGKPVTFTGAFLEDDSGAVLITPVSIDLGK